MFRTKISVSSGKPSRICGTWIEICQVLPPIQRLLGCMQNRIMMEVRVNVYISVIAHMIRQFSVYNDRNVRVAVQMLQYSC